MPYILEHALIYVSLGMAVIPLHRPVKQEGRHICSCGKFNCHSAAKHPFGQLVPKGFKDATKDRETIECWFKDTPYNVGIATGAASGVFVLDIDPRHDGDETLAQLERKHGELPPTWRFLTGGGGEHILFRHPGGIVPNSAGKIGKGIDVRGDGGYAGGDL